MIDLKDLEQRLLTASGADDPATSELVARVAVDAAQLYARAAVGEDVAEEAKHLRAQAFGLTAAVRSRLNEAMLTWFREVTERVVIGVLAL